ncbi:MAG: hypothetical protein KAX49_05020 [Halanaerobiales bacterium]|nr:hypothetical protein [Halanaerobiales bacterium]
MTVKIVEVTTKKLRREFIKLSWKIYKNDPVWVPPLVSEMKKTITGKSNTLTTSGPSVLILAKKDGETVGRLCIGINKKLNEFKKIKQGYLTLFESINKEEVSKALFDYAMNWLRGQGMTTIIGPLAPPNGDDYRGLLLENFEDSPMVMNIYNPSYYNKLFTSYGFEKFWDFFGYHYDLTQGIPERFKKVAEYAQKKYKFRVDPVNLKDLYNEARDVKKIMDVAMPSDWPDFYPPTFEDIEVVMKSMKPVADPELVYIARNDKNEPIGFSIALPDYNQAIKHLNGRLLPFGFFKFLWYKRKINAARIFVLFVVPDYQKKGVTASIYLRSFEAAIKKGMTIGEGSTIAELNPAMCRDAEGAGGKLSKTFRIYKRDVS